MIDAEATYSRPAETSLSSFDAAIDLRLVGAQKKIFVSIPGRRKSHHPDHLATNQAVSGTNSP